MELKDRNSKRGKVPRDSYVGTPSANPSDSLGDGAGSTGSTAAPSERHAVVKQRQGSIDPAGGYDGRARPGAHLCPQIRARFDLIRMSLRRKIAHAT